jgi:hypothetical protein
LQRNCNQKKYIENHHKNIINFNDKKKRKKLNI